MPCSLPSMSSKKGKAAEDAAARYLKLRGYRILARNVRGSGGELDIVVRRGDILAFVEVKQRPQRAAALEAVHADKQLRLIAAARAFLARQPQLQRLQCRFDLIILTPGRWLPHVEHLTDVFRFDDA